jgi:hypothetical protein
LSDQDEPFIKARRRLFGALGLAETMCVALGRALDMLARVPSQFSISVSLPPSVSRLLPALREIRNAFEHIEDRALGNVQRKPHADALSIFDQRELVSRGVLRYGAHSLDLQDEILPMLVQARHFVLDAAIETAGAVRTLEDLIRFPSAPPGSFERIQERAYFLWENRSGAQWWNPDANWLEAERIDAAKFPAAD